MFETFLEYKLLGGGKIQFAKGKLPGGMAVGKVPVMVRLAENRLYPDGWFPISSNWSMNKLKKEFMDHLGQGERVLPCWVRAACFEYHYNQLINKK